MAPLRQCLARMAADITGAPRDKYFHDTPLSNILQLSYLFFSSQAILILSNNSTLIEQFNQNLHRQPKAQPPDVIGDASRRFVKCWIVMKIEVVENEFCS